MSGREENALPKFDFVDTKNSENEPPEDSPADIEKREDAKLQAKYPMAERPMSGHSVFLQKRLAHKQKYFDSGDYQMAKQKSAVKTQKVSTGLSYATGEVIPTPESVPVRKTSIIQPCKVVPSSTT